MAYHGGATERYVAEAGADRAPLLSADVPRAKAALMASGRGPIAEAALKEAAGEPAWKSLRSYFVYGKRDKSTPPAALSFMARRAHSRHTSAIAIAIVIVGASPIVNIASGAGGRGDRRGRRG